MEYLEVLESMEEFLGSDLEQIDILKTKRNLYQDRKFYEDEDFGKDISNIQDKAKELNGARNLNPYLIDICSDDEKDKDNIEDKDNIDNEIADLNNNGECEWNDRKKFYVKKKFILEHQLPEKKERFTKRKNVKKNMKNNKKNEDAKNKKFYRKLIKEVERAFDLGQRKQIQKKIAEAPNNERLVSLMPL